MNLQERIDLLVKLGSYMMSEDPAWLSAKEKANRENGWFVAAFTDIAVSNIAERFLKKETLQSFARKYQLPEENNDPKKVGLVPAGNIPLVGFHDVICIFLTGHFAWIKPSSKDTVLIGHLVKYIHENYPDAADYFQIKERLNDCDAYIATGSNNSSRYFEYYFGKYPHIIRKNRTSAAILTGKESPEELEKLADDICQFFGMGCRNVTHLSVPENYDFIPLIEALNKYKWMEDHNKFRNNYDHQLALHILNNKYYMTNGAVLLIESEHLFAPVSQVNYTFYKEKKEAETRLEKLPDLQCLVGEGHISFGAAQCPEIGNFADGVDTMEFLVNLKGK